MAVVICSILYYQFDEIQSEPMNFWVSPTPVGQCGVVLTGAPGRVRESFEILAQRKIQKLIVSGVYKDSQLREIFPYLPFYPEVSESDIILEKKSETTYGNAIQSLVLVESLKCKTVVLMTSQVHMRRAYRIFRSTFPSEIEIHKLSLPNSKTEKNLIDVLIEVFKTLFYFALGLVV